jgi:hypothetical protein
MLRICKPEGEFVKIGQARAVKWPFSSRSKPESNKTIDVARLHVDTSSVVQVKVMRLL